MSRLGLISAIILAVTFALLVLIDRVLSQPSISGTFDICFAGQSCFGSAPFTPLHTYFMSPTGSDGAAGTSTSTAWATPNHAGLVCGDVIIADTGSYSNIGLSSQPGTCPSTTGGIDGSGGVYFVTILCATSFGCTMINASSGQGSWNVTANNWAIEGWQLSGSGGRSFMSDATASGTTIIHHVAFINDISINSRAGFVIDEGAANHNVPGNGTDYFAVVGNISQNSSQDSICLASVDVVAPANFDANAGTHIFINGNFIWHSQNSSGCIALYDSEAMLADTLDAHGYAGQVIYSNNVAWTADRYCWQAFFQGNNVSAPVVKVYNNTCYDNLVNVGPDFADGEINLGASSASNSTWPLTIQNNIALTGRATSGSGGGVPCPCPVYAMNAGGTVWTTLTIGGSGTENIYKGSAATCNGTCDSGNNVTQFHGNTLGTNTYVSPAFNNTTDLLANWDSGTPSCSGFINVTACMGYNANTQVTTTLTPISDLTPTAGGMTGKGYQLPSTTCAANADYPTWLKGIVYLQASGFVNGATITENAGLVSKPCGM